MLRLCNTTGSSTPSPSPSSAGCISPFHNGGRARGGEVGILYFSQNRRRNKILWTKSSTIPSSLKGKCCCSQNTTKKTVSREIVFPELKSKPSSLLLSVAVGSLAGPQSVLQALGVLAAIVTVHESGHFLAAYLQNIHVSKFAIGFGPMLFKFDIKNVECSLRAIPLGGYVGFPDDDQDSGIPPDDKDLLKNRPILDRVIVTVAGVAANLVFAYSILFAQALTVGLVEQEPFPGVLVPEVFSSSSAARDGMESGDVVLGVEGRVFAASEPAVYELVDVIKKSPGRRLSFLVERRSGVREVQVTPDAKPDGTGKIGVQLAPNVKTAVVKAADLADATVRAGGEFWRLLRSVVEGLRQVFMNFSESARQVSGPVAIVAVGAEVARSSAAGVFQFAAVVNLNLAVVNLLPLPALDGGYLALIALEALRGGKKLPKEVERGIMSSGTALVLLLGVFLIVRDTLELDFVRDML